MVKKELEISLTSEGSNPCLSSYSLTRFRDPRTPPTRAVSLLVEDDLDVSGPLSGLSRTGWVGGCVTGEGYDREVPTVVVVRPPDDTPPPVRPDARPGPHTPRLPRRPPGPLTPVFEGRRRSCVDTGV